MAFGKWTSVKDGLPATGQVVLALLAKQNSVSDLDVVEFQGGNRWDKWRAPYTVVTDVTHWMLLPEKPC